MDWEIRPKGDLRASRSFVIPDHVANGTAVPVSLTHLGIRNLYLNLQIQVASEAF